MSAKRDKQRTPKRDNVCSKCHIGLKPNQLFCFECGTSTDVLRIELSAVNNIRTVWDEMKEKRGNYYPFAIFYFFAILVPLGLIVYATASNYLLNNLALLLFLPLAFIPFAFRYWEEKESFTVKNYISNLKAYPPLLIFTAINIIYFFVLKYVASGLDPILNLVRLIMVFYWLAIVLPLPFYLIRKEGNFLRGLIAVIKGGKEPRWQLFFTYLILFLFNLVGLAMLGLGLLVTIPLTFAVLERYYLQMDKYQLFDSVQAESKLKSKLKEG